MAKKFNKPSFEEPEETSADSNKLPIDSTGSGQILEGFRELPVTRLHPFTRKGSSDFSRHNQVLSDQFVESIKEYGILEPILVRKSQTERGFYEIISGESRWQHAKEANLDLVPCRIMNLTDEKAENLFIILNLMRRELSIRDKIYGWYMYYTNKKNQGYTNAELNAAITDDTSEAAALSGGKGITLRMIQMYVKAHNLTDAWLDRLENGMTTFKVGYRVAFFPPDIQEELLKYKCTNGDRTVKNLLWLYQVYSGEVKGTSWDLSLIGKTLEPLAEKGEEEKPKLTKEERAASKKEKALQKAFKAAMPKMVETVQIKLRPDDYGRADQVIATALDLYYAQIQKTEPPVENA